MLQGVVKKKSDRLLEIRIEIFFNFQAILTNQPMKKSSSSADIKEAYAEI